MKDSKSLFDSQTQGQVDSRDFHLRLVSHSWNRTGSHRSRRVFSKSKHCIQFQSKQLDSLSTNAHRSSFTSETLPWVGYFPMIPSIDKKRSPPCKSHDSDLHLQTAARPSNFDLRKRKPEHFRKAVRRSKVAVANQPIAKTEVNSVLWEKGKMAASVIRISVLK